MIKFSFFKNNQFVELILFFLIFNIVFSMTACSKNDKISELKSPLVFSMIDKGERIELIVNNNSGDDYSIVTPLDLSPSSNVGGVEYVIINSKNEKINLCGLSNPVSSPRVVFLKPKEEYAYTESVDFIKKMFCLNEGDYKIRGILHNIFNGKIIGDSISSQEITIRIVNN